MVRFHRFRIVIQTVGLTQRDVIRRLRQVNDFCLRRHNFHPVCNVYECRIGTAYSDFHIHYIAPWRLRGIVPNQFESFKGCSRFGRIAKARF